MNTVDEEVNLNVKLEFHRLRIFGPQRERDELRELLKEGLTLSLIKELNKAQLTDSSSFLISS